MAKRCFTSTNGAPAVGPYSHGVAVPCGAGELLFVSGQIPAARDGSGVVRGSIEEETRLVLDNLRVLLEDAGAGLKDVVKTTVFLADMNKFAAFNAVYKEYFPEEPPARSCVQVARLPLDVQVEVEAIALLPGH